MRKVYLLAALFVAASADLRAQKTGTLLNRSENDRIKRHGAVQDLSAAERAKADTIFAVLVFDPSVSLAGRSTAWTATVDPVGANKEGKIQVNLCDIAGSLCSGKSAASVTLAGPLSATDSSAELADLNGLVGTARATMTWTTNSTQLGAFYSFSGTYGEPSFAYRDSAALAKRSVDHAAYALAADAGTRSGATAWQAGVRYEQSYRARTSQDVCTPASFGPSGTTTCSSLIVGAPSSAERFVASMSGVWSFGGHGAARVIVSQDLAHGVTGIDMPVWVIPDAKGGPAGGLRFGYRTDTKHVTVSLFVSAFKL